VTKRAARRRREGSGEAPQSLPALSTLTDLPAFDELTVSQRQRGAFADACERVGVDGTVGCETDLVLGCVVRLDRGFPAVACAGGVFRAEFSARLTKGRSGDGGSRVAVGDWVCARRPLAHDMGLIEEVLPRESDIARWRGGARGERQTLAANVDVVLVVQQLGERPVSCERIARSAVIARDCGARVAVVLTKADRASDEVLARDVACVREILGDSCALALTSSAQREKERRRVRDRSGELGVAWGADAVRALVPAGVVAIVLGESGAGKSTLLNALVGRDVLETGSVRVADDAGRHTTVARRMVSLPGAGVVVDEPGLRSLPLVGHERGLSQVFPEISEAARTCRFRDCTHLHEPGCAVRAQHEEGVVSDERLACYLALAAEMRKSASTLDPDVVI
jgi:ribosome biogenesis GTPase